MKKINKDKILIAILIVLFAVYGFFVSNKQKYSNTDTLKDSDNKIESNNIVDDSEIFVHIDGEVINPGLYKFNKDERIDDAITKAGGTTENASMKNINLAQKLEDEMKIFIPSDVSNQGDSNQDNMVTQDDSIKLLNINSATKEELMTLPGIGDIRAESIIKYREESSFKKIEDLMNISGIGEKTFEALKDLITI